MITNLRAILEYFEIPNRDLAQAINVSPSMVSNWVQGKRALRASSGYAAAIADYVLSMRQLTSRDIAWLKKHFVRTGISTDFDSASDIKRNLILWLSDDGQEVLEIFKKTESIHAAKEQKNTAKVSGYIYSIGPAGRIYGNDYSARAGIVDISLRLGRILDTMAEGMTVDICLSSETASIIAEEVFINEIIRAFRGKNMHVRMLIAISSSSMALSRIIATYLQMIINGNMELYISQGMMQPMIHQSTLLIPGTCAVAITELPGSFSPPAALFITEDIFLKDAVNGFERIVRYARPVMQFFHENALKGIAELFHREFSEDGNLDILNDGINPLMLTREEYMEILSQKGFKGNALEWRSEEYLRIKEGFENNLKRGAVFREIISLEYVKNMVLNGSCELPSLYFMDTGRTLIGIRSCIAILKGYSRLMGTYPNYHLSVASQLDEVQQGTRHIKHNRHITLNPWKMTKPMLIYSDEIIMLHEFQIYFNALWMEISGGMRENARELLDIMAEEMEKVSEQGG